MKSVLQRTILINLGCLLLSTTLSAQDDLEINRVKSARLVEIFNNVEFFQRGRTKDYIIRLYKLHNGLGSAGFRNGEVSYNLFVAISEFDETPDQNLFEIGPLYNPVFKQWKDSEKEGIFTIEYGPEDDRLTVALSVDIYTLRILPPDK